MRIRPDTYAALRALTARIAQEGWQSVGAQRAEPPTIAAVVALAVEHLAARR